MTTKKSYNMNYPKNDIITWKQIWNDIISDIDFRNWFVGNNGFYHLYKNNRVDDLSKDTTPAQKNRGTLYMQFPGNYAHFVAYKKQKNQITIFDPSYLSGTYAGCLPDFVDTILNKFKLPIHYEIVFGTPQYHKNDSFCQTWSLAYLSKSPKLHKYLKDALNDSVLALFNICKFFINTKIFQKEICVDQAAFINKNIRKNKAPKKWNAEYFLNYSNDMDFEMFSHLFN
jgi:hypothetical protein